MIKKILLSITVLLVIAYLAIALTTFNNKPRDLVCQKVELIIKDTVNAEFVTKNEINNLLKNKGLSPIGKR